MELQAYRIYTRRDEGAWGYGPFAEPTDVELNDEQVYIKSEADHYIARQKYKRCLAKADMNWWQSNRYSAAEMVERIRGNFENAYQCSKLEQRYYKRYKIWLGLAEKLKVDL